MHGHRYARVHLVAATPAFVHQARAPPSPLCGGMRPLPGSIRLAVGREDALEQHLQRFLAQHPEVRARHSVTRKGNGVYELDGRPVLLEWQAARELGGQGRLLVVDGPLRQPLADYVDATEANAEYEAVVADLGRRSVHVIPRERRVSFDDQHQAYSRLDAMKVAKEQALVREKAAGYLKAGRALPGDMMANYSKAIQQKLAPVGIHELCEWSAAML